MAERESAADVIAAVIKGVATVGVDVPVMDRPVISKVQQIVIPYEETTDLEAVLPSLDVLYMTRVQKERFFNEQDYIRLKDSYILTPLKLAKAKADCSVLHPLPRVNEISVGVDADPRACYFRQVLNGKYIRMALIKMLLEAAEKEDA